VHLPITEITAQLVWRAQAKRRIPNTSGGAHLVLNLLVLLQVAILPAASCIRWWPNNILDMFLIQLQYTNSHKKTEVLDNPGPAEEQTG
jgi:hypothetical protein